MARRTSSLQPRDIWLFLVALIPFAVLAAIHWDWKAPSGYGDHAQYLAHAKAIAEGRSYTDIGYIYHPAAPMIGPRAYPPGLPLTLAPIVALAGTDSPWNRVLMLASLVLFAWLAFRRLAIALAPWQAALAAGFTALALESRLATIAPMSDLGFCALLWALILAGDTQHTWTWKRIALVTALGFATMAYRVPGVVVVPAVALYALFTWREHRGRKLIPVAIWSLTGIAVLAAGIVELPFSAYLLPRLGEIGDRFTSMARVYKSAVFDGQLYPFGQPLLNDAYHLVASSAVLAGTLVLLWRYRHSMMAATCLMYGAMLVASPVSDGRYAWPLYPLLAAGLVLSTTAASRFVARHVAWYRRPASVAAGILVLILVLGAWQESRVTPPRPLYALPKAHELFAWIKEENARAPMRAIFVNPRLLALETGVPAMGALGASPAMQLDAMRERRISHVVTQLEDVTTCRARLLNAMPRFFPDNFVLEFRNGTFEVYRFKPFDGPAPPESAVPPEEVRAICAGLMRA
ncbi:MAG: hypothetical protein AB1762_01990 [Gemmatimonadota bacterium]